MKKRFGSRLLSIVLAIALIAGSFDMTAFAGEVAGTQPVIGAENDAAEAAETEEIQLPTESEKSDYSNEEGSLQENENADQTEGDG